jgi:hypothetical protein
MHPPGVFQIILVSPFETTVPSQLVPTTGWEGGYQLSFQIAAHV